MSLLLSCPPGPTPNVCAPTTDDVLNSVIGLLPPGPAWEGAQREGTVQRAYWRAYASVLNYLYSRMCAFVDEFFCATVKESREQWIDEYGLNDVCDPYGNNLCVKVAAQGGATCDYFVDIARLSGWVITCHDVSKDPEPIAGCFEVGCTPLGPEPKYLPYGSRIGYGQRGVCQYGEVVQHPDKAKWENGNTAGAMCPVPGSNLGHGPDANESCCFIVGYYDFDVPPPPVSTNYCVGEETTITFECPRENVPSDPNPMDVAFRTIGGYDENRNYIEWGNSFVWEVTVDIGASQAAQAAALPPPPPEPYTDSSAGNFMAGNTPENFDGMVGGSPLCADTSASTYQPTFVLCFLDRIKPAHTTLNVKVIQP